MASSRGIPPLTYYVDKTDILADLVPLVEGKGQRYVAITTRPRRFGKTVMANMIVSYFGRGIDSQREFDALRVSRYPWYKKHLNQPQCDSYCVQRAAR